MRRVCVVTGTRAEYGLLKPVMQAIQESGGLGLQVVATGMHLAPEFGLTVEAIKQDGFAVDSAVDMLFSSDTPGAMAKGTGIGVYGMTQALESLRPDVVMVLGDRVEAFAAAIAGAFLGKAVAHIHGGDRARGGLDDYMRHAITKLSHLHLTATEESRRRVIRLGEPAEHVFNVGAPGISDIHTESADLAELRAQLGFDPEREPFLLVVQHPVSTESGEAERQMTETLEAVFATGLRAVLIYPNSDAGGRAMIEVIERHEGDPRVSTFRSLPRPDYLALLRRTRVLVGNSSSGIIESPSFHTPVVNIGMRQQGRERSTNVLDAEPERSSILSAIERALHDQEFLARVRTCQNPYGDGRAPERIVRILQDAVIDPALLTKQITY